MSNAVKFPRLPKTKGFYRKVKYNHTNVHAKLEPVGTKLERVGTKLEPWNLFLVPNHIHL